MYGPWWYYPNVVVMLWSFKKSTFAYQHVVTRSALDKCEDRAGIFRVVLRICRGACWDRGWNDMTKMQAEDRCFGSRPNSYRFGNKTTLKHNTDRARRQDHLTIGTLSKGPWCSKRPRALLEATDRQSWFVCLQYSAFLWRIILLISSNFF